VNPAWTVRTGRLILTAVSAADLPELATLKGDPRVYAVMLGGVRTRVQVAAELADDLAFWATHRVGMWAVRPREGGPMLGLVGIHARPDGRGMALRFAFHADARGRGLASEAAGAALRYAHEEARLRRVIAVARETNFASRMVLGGIGMVPCGTFEQQGHTMILYESVSPGS
jgi:RimJ/RimL family protein N-acetyltransferase